jgi:hypothetical protein
MSTMKSNEIIYGNKITSVPQLDWQMCCCCSKLDDDHGAVNKIIKITHMLKFIRQMMWVRISYLELSKRWEWKSIL